MFVFKPFARFILVSSLVFSLLLTAFPARALAQADEHVHIVQRGETLSRIAQRYGTTWRQLADLNNLSNPNLIYVV